MKAKDALKQLPNVDPPGEGQLFAYHVAELKDRNVDESRNPAKSVTVQ